MVMGHDDLLAFAAQVDAVGGRKKAALAACRAWLAGRAGNPNRDTIPRDVWETHAKPAMRRNGVTMRAMQSALGMAFAGAALYKANVSRSRLGGWQRLSAVTTGSRPSRPVTSTGTRWCRSPPRGRKRSTT